MAAHVQSTSSAGPSGMGVGADDGSLNGEAERLERPPRRQQQQRNNYGSNDQDTPDAVGLTNLIYPIFRGEL